jgi:hypothetical protein
MAAGVLLEVAHGNERAEGRAGPLRVFLVFLAAAGFAADFLARKIRFRVQFQEFDDFHFGGCHKPE